MTLGPLARRLADAIRRDGPVPVSRYMEAALSDPDHGYYTTRDPLGAAGDFTTAPEISQMFGELIGLWAAVVWQAMGAPDRVVLVELGPGRGTLMADLLRAAATMPAFLAAIDSWLVETSPVLRDRQRETLADRAVHWADRIEDVPDGPALIVANEFFDALPIDQYIRMGGVWRERRVDLGADGGFVFVAGPEVPAPATGLPDGAIVETCPEGRRLAALMGRRLARSGGAALIVDYGSAAGGSGDTLQAVRRHRFHPALDDPGEADLTAHVDFAALATAAAPAKAWGPVGQGDFLRALGIETRAALLAKGQPPARAADIKSGMRRLIDAAEMGTLFKVMGMAHPALAEPPGFSFLP